MDQSSSVINQVANRFLANNAEGKTSGDSNRKCDYVKTNSYLLHSIQQNIHPTNKGGDGTGLRSTVQEV